MGHLAFKDGKTVYERDMNEIGEMLVDALREINGTLEEILVEIKNIGGNKDES